MKSYKEILEETRKEICGKTINEIVEIIVGLKCELETQKDIEKSIIESSYTIQEVENAFQEGYNKGRYE